MRKKYYSLTPFVFYFVASGMIAAPLTTQSTSIQSISTANPAVQVAQPITYQSIKKLKDAGQLEKAKQDAMAYLQKNPNDADVKLILGFIYYQQKNFPYAQDLAIAVLRQVPKYEDARMLLINTLIATKQYQAAAMQVNEGFKYNPNSIELRNAKVRLETLLKTQSAPQTKILTPQQKPKAAERSVDYSKLELEKLRALKNSGRLEEGKKEAISYLKQHPTDLDVKLVLGTIYYQQKKYDQSIKIATEVIKKVPTYTDARMLLILNEIAEQQHHRALHQITLGLRYSPRDPRLLAAEEKVMKTLIQQAELTKKKIT